MLQMSALMNLLKTLVVAFKSEDYVKTDKYGFDEIRNIKIV